MRIKLKVAFFTVLIFVLIWFNGPDLWAELRKEIDVYFWGLAVLTAADIVWEHYEG